MSRKEKILSARAVAALQEPGKHSDGGGLYLMVSHRESTLRRNWAYVYTWQGKLREMGLGAYPTIGLAEAREARDKWRKVLLSGQSPIEARGAEKSTGAVPTFGRCVEDFLVAKGAQWSNAKHAAQWRSTLETYARPLWGLPVDRIDTAAVLGALQPIWTEKPETASRVRGRIEAVLDAAKAKGLRSGENPARWRGHLDHLLPKRRALSRGHHAAMPYATLPAFMQALRARQDGSIAAMALEFGVLTGARSGEVLGARWSEVDLEARVWTVPAVRMKARTEHRVPLSQRAVATLQGLSEVRTGPFVFPGQRLDRPLSGMSMAMLLRRMGVETTVHGFRSSFRDWVGNETHFPRELAEAALAHTIGDKAEQAYRRSDALEKRRTLMQAWCDFLAGRNVDVVQLRRPA